MRRSEGNCLPLRLSLSATHSGTELRLTRLYRQRSYSQNHLTGPSDFFEFLNVSEDMM